MKDFFLKATHKRIWYLTHSTRNGICFCVMDSNTVTDFELLQRDALSDYHAVIDDNDTVHLACQNSDGDILYFRNAGKGWSKYTVLKSRTKESYPKNFRLLPTASALHLFYSVRSADKILLTHQIIDGGRAEPVALDYISGSFFCCSDAHENIYLFYRSNDVFGFRSFDSTGRVRSSFAALDNTKGVEANQFFIDSAGNLHIAGVVDSSVVYIRIPDFANRAANISDGGQTVKLVRAGDSLGRSLKFGRGHTPIIFSCANNLFLMWNLNEKIQAFCSTDMGLSWQPNEFVSGRRMPLTLFGLSYTKHEAAASGIRASNCFGYISENIVYLYGLGKFFEIRQTAPQYNESPAVHPDIAVNQVQYRSNSETEPDLQQRGRVHFFKGNGIETVREDDFEVMRREFENELKMKYSAKNGVAEADGYGLSEAAFGIQTTSDSGSSGMDLVKLKILIETYLGRCDKLERMIEGISGGVSRCSELVARLCEETESFFSENQRHTPFAECSAAEKTKAAKKKKSKKSSAKNSAGGNKNGSLK